jgi:glycosyltransferase involved in cell wall biosynthesis
MKFCMVTSFYPPFHFGGDGTYVRALSEALVKRGHHVTVIHCEDAYRLKANGRVGVSGKSSGVHVHRIKKKSGFLSPLITQQFGVPGLKSAELKNIFSEEYDVVNFHNISLIGGPGIIPLSKAPVNIYTLHEHWLLCPTHIFWKNGKAPCDSRQCIRCCIRSRTPPQFWRFGPLISRSIAKIDSFIAPSEYTAGKHHELLNEPTDIKVIPLFSNLAPEQYSYTGSEKPGFLFVGRVTASKGIIELVASFSRWPNYTLTVIGDGDLLEDLQYKCRDSHNIVFLGELPQHELIKYYRSAIALILPSLAPETFGLTVVEAFACGTPAIVRSAGGNRETIDNSGAGFVYQDEKQLATYLEDLSNNRELRIQLGRRARGAYEKHYTEDIHVSRYLSLVKRILAEKSS